MALSFETILGAWLATGLTLFIFSFLYKDNPLFKVAEHLYVGVSLGYTIIKTFDTVIGQLILKPLEIDPYRVASLFLTLKWQTAAREVINGIANHADSSFFVNIMIPVAIGMLMLTRYVPKAAWLSRYAFAFIVGVGAGLAIPRMISSVILKQIEDTVRPLLSAVPGDGVTFSLDLLSPSSNLNGIIILFGVVSVLFYFFFSVEHTGAGKVIARAGIFFLMISFGAGFGYTVMARMSLLIGRLTDLIQFSDSSYGSPTIWLLVLTIITLIVLSRREPSSPSDHS